MNRNLYGNIINANSNISQNGQANNIFFNENNNPINTSAVANYQINQSKLSSNNNNNKILSENYDHQNSDSVEVKELKNRMKVIMNKLNNCKKDKEQLEKNNKCLQEEVMTLQSNLRQMISGFSNTSSSFPMLNELTLQIQEFYKYDCLDVFFDTLCPELNMKGILFFFHTSFSKLSEAISQYLNPPQQIIKKVGCFDSIDGPIMNVLRKSYQQNYKKIIQKCLNKDLIENICNFIQSNLKLGGISEETNELIQQFLLKLGEILFYFQISDPPLQYDYKTIGTKVTFNQLKHDPFDGFIKNKQECIVVLPSIFKNNDSTEDLTKALVLQIDYEIPN